MVFRKNEIKIFFKRRNFIMKHKLWVSLAFLGLGLLFSANLWAAASWDTVHDKNNGIIVSADNDAANVNVESIEFYVSSVSRSGFGIARIYIMTCTSLATRC